MKQYDIAVIGAGSGGLVAALTANRHGLKVAMLEKNKIGGECTHSGCVPSKTLISSARLYNAMKHADRLGLPSFSASDRLNFSSVMEHVDNVVQGVYQSEQPSHFQDLGIDVYVDPTGAFFSNAHEIRIGRDIISADHVIIATGSSPRMAPHEGGELLHYLTNENFWAIRELPKSIVFLGGGVISAEIGQSLARFGSEITIVDRNPRILRVVDEEVGSLLSDILQREGIQLLTNTNIINCSQLEGKKARLLVENKERQEEILAEEIFVALGRVPNIDGMGLENTGVEYSDHGITSNDFLQTSSSNIYVCGDVTTRAKFTHIASYQAEICVENIIEGNHRKNDLSVVPWAIFTDPEIGHVGMSEAQARQEFDDIHISRVGADTIDRFKTESVTEGFLKLVIGPSNEILGADAIGNHAGEWIQFFTLAIKHKLPMQSLGDLIFIYPTFSEIVKKSISRYLRSIN